MEIDKSIAFKFVGIYKEVNNLRVFAGKMPPQNATLLLDFLNKISRSISDVIQNNNNEQIILKLEKLKIEISNAQVEILQQNSTDYIMLNIMFSELTENIHILLKSIQH